MPWAYDQRLLEHAGAIGGRIIAPPAVNFTIEAASRVARRDASTSWLFRPAQSFRQPRRRTYFQACLSDAFRGVPSREPLCRQTRKPDPLRDGLVLDVPTSGIAPS